MHRLFVAFPLPTWSASALNEWASASFPPAFVRVLSPEDMHATIAFYAEVDAAWRDRLAELVRNEQFEPYTVRIAGFRPFGKSALAVTLRRMGQLERKGRPLDSEFSWAGRVGSFGNSLHVTVARVRGKSVDRIPALAPPRLEFLLDHLALYESHLAPGGSRYEIIARSPRPPGDTPPES